MPISIGFAPAAMPDPSAGMRYSGAVFRAHNPQWAFSPLSGEGAKQYGGRFNRPGQAALYTALQPLTAIREASPLGRPMQPLTLCEYAVDCAPIIDTRDPAACTAEAITTAECDCPDWERQMLQGRTPPSQALADRLIAKGYAGILVRSYARGAASDEMNLVFWVWSDAPPTKVTVIDPDGRLPRDQRSWLP